MSIFDNVMNILKPQPADRNFAAATITAGKFEDLRPNRQVFIQANDNSAVLQKRTGPGLWGPIVPAATVTLGQMQKFFSFIEEFGYWDDKHRNCIREAVWRGLYNVQVRPLTYRNRDDTVKPTPPAETVACYDCGIVLPLSHIDIDHQRPKGGKKVIANANEPVCKCFRAMGLTKGGSKGLKGASLLAQFALAVGGAAAAVGTDVDRYTLSDVGQIYYTLINEQGDRTTLEQLCLNHIANLRPLCGVCNKPNRNKAKFP